VGATSKGLAIDMPLKVPNLGEDQSMVTIPYNMPFTMSRVDLVEMGIESPNCTFMPIYHT